MKLWSIILLTLLSFSVNASQAIFSTGPVFSDFGKHAKVEGVNIPADSEFKVVFDVTKAAETGTVNREIDSLARFINMHVAAGVRKENIHLALVVHGGATLDMLNDKAYRERFDTKNGSLPLLAALADFGVRMYVCGQSAAAHSVKPGELTDGVELALSAMTAHALLQQEGYTLNP